MSYMLYPRMFFLYSALALIAKSGIYVILYEAHHTILTNKPRTQMVQRNTLLLKE